MVSLETMLQTTSGLTLVIPSITSSLLMLVLYVTRDALLAELSWGQAGIVVFKNRRKPITEQYGNIHGRMWLKVAASMCVVGRGLWF